MPFDKNDLKQLQNLRNDIVDTLVAYIDKRIDKAVEPLATKNDIKHLPTKEEFFTRMDQLAGKYQNFSVEAPNIAKKLSDLEIRVDKIEDKLGLSFS